MQQYQKDFIDFLVNSGALSFGDYTTKSGRKTPYFINTGKFDEGGKISALGKFYADHIMKSGLDKADIIFGPAYKGIPLCVATASAMAGMGKNVGFSFNRKEAKDHGDAGIVVGKKIKDGDKVLLVEDVITAGTTMREIVPFLRSLAAVEILGVVVSVDRKEKGTGDLSAVQEVEKNYNLKVYPVVTIADILERLGPRITADQLAAAGEYLKKYGI